MLEKSNYERVINRRFVKFSQTTLVVLFLFSFFRFYTQNYSIAIADASAGLAMFFNLKSRYSIDNKVNVVLLIGLSLFVVFMYHSFIDPTLWFWGYIFPPFAYLLNDIKNGKKWSLIFGFVLVVIFLLQEFFQIQTGHSRHEFLVFISVYTLISALMHQFKKEIDLYIGELEDLNRSLHSLVEEEVEKNKIKDKILHTQAKQAQMGEMLSMIAHQWRQPLNTISASIIKMQLENEMQALSQKKINETAEFIQEQTQNLSEIINSFLDLSKPSSQEKTFLLSSVIERVLKTTLNQFEKHNIVIETIYDIDYKEEPLKGSGHLYEQVLLNLLMNTKDAFDEKQDIEDKTIIIYIETPFNVRVKDNAGGIPLEVVDKVFNPYFTTKEEGKGVGLGLYMSLKIMQSHFHGDLIYMPNNNGSCFNIIINKESTNV